MRLTDVFATAWNNIKGRKKTGRLLFVLLFLTLCIYMSVNSIALSVSNAAQKISETPDVRLIVYNNEDETLYSKLKDTCADMEQVADVYPFVFELPVEAEGVEEEQRTELGVWSYSKEYEDYIVEGKAPKEGEILLPHYMFATTDGNYEDGSEYIGKSITIYITDMLEKEHSMICKVSGTYNNINAVTDGYIVLMYPQDAVTLDEWQWEGDEEETEKTEEEPIEPGVVVIENKFKYSFGVIVDKTENYEKVRKEISEKIDISGQKIVMEGSSIDDNLIPVIRLICTGLTIILLIVSVVMMVIMIHNDILGRKKELSVYLVQGYTKKSLRQMLGVEYMMRLVPALLWAIVGTFGVLAIGSNVIKKMFPWEHTLIQLKLSASGLVASIVMMCIILAVATYTIHAQLSKINLLKEIKSEG